VAIENREKELNVIYNDISDEKLVLPNFQRGFIWNREQQTKLLASILVGLPVGSLLILEGKSNDFSKRELCFPTELITDRDCDYVLDGQQRLSTLRSMFYDLFSRDDWKNNWDKMYGSLRTRWFVTIQSSKSEADVFGYRKLNFDSLLKCTDSELIDYIKPLPIHKTKVNDLYNPGYIVKGPDGNPEIRPAFIKDFFSTQYAALNQVPLWEVRSRNGLHRNVLKKIATKRISELKVEAENEDYSLEYYENIFSPINVTRDDLELDLNGDDTGLDINDKLAEKWAALHAQWVEKVSIELEGMPSRKMAIINLNREEVNRAAAIFEAINRGGVPLSMYDLVVAKSARDQGVQNLSTKIINSVESNININTDIFTQYGVGHEELGDCWSSKDMKIIVGNEPSNTLKDWFVNLLSLLVHVRFKKEACSVEHIKREKILSLTCDEVNEFSDAAIQAIIRALCFVQLRCGVINANDLSYKLMVVVLAYHLSDNDIWDSNVAINQLEYWYWLSLFGGSYFHGQNLQCVKDITDVGDFISGGGNVFLGLSREVLNVENYVTKDILLRKDDGEELVSEIPTIIEPKSIRVGLLQFILSRTPSDLVKHDSGETTVKKLSAWSASKGEPELEVHHIIPLAEATSIGESTKALRKDASSIMNSSLNLSYISKQANRKLSSASPSEYVQVIHDMASATNYLPSNDSFTQVLHDKDYSRILAERYMLLENGIKNHIASLI